MFTFPVYIPTKGRPAQQLTANRLLGLGTRPTLVVEAAEADSYRSANPECAVEVWPQEYFDNYEKTPELDPHPTTGAAHNFAWDHSRSLGFTHHWIMDDNIKGFSLRDDKGKFVSDPAPKALTGSFLHHEAVAQKYSNLAGLALGLGNTFSEAPFILNTRLYCATLYRNDLDQYGIKWRRGLNDDTIVSLDILKTGFLCTAESHLLMISKVPTSRAKRMAGGMTDFYAQGGFIRKAAEAVRCHPDCVRVAVRHGRIHHHIDYRQFTQKLIKTPSP